MHMRQNYPTGHALGKEFTTKNLAPTPAIGNKILSKNTFGKHRRSEGFELRGLVACLLECKHLAE